MVDFRILGAGRSGGGWVEFACIFAVGLLGWVGVC
jgi:hypothetical protein